MKTRAILFAGAAAAAMLLPSAAFAGADDYIAKFCANQACASPATTPTIENQQLRPTWEALTAAGTAQFLGGAIDGVRLTPATMVAGARVLGVPAFDAMLRTGQVPFAGREARAAAVSRMGAVSGVDINTVVGLPQQTSAGTPNRQADGGANLAASPAAFVTGQDSAIPGATAVSGCDPQVERMQIAAAANNVNQASTLATSGMGYTRMDGQGAMQSLTNELGSGGRSMANGFTGTNCLSNLFQFANLDMLFQPPLMSNLMSQVNGMTCQQAISAIASLGGPVSAAVFQTSGMGGFFPGANLSAFAGSINGAATGNFTGIPNLAGTLGGGYYPSRPAISTIGTLYSNTGFVNR